MTILTASFSKLSPKMTLYSLGSTLYCWKIARIVTGSVADNVDPNVRHSSSVMSKDSKPRNEYMYTNTLFNQLINKDMETMNTKWIVPYSDRRYKCPEECEYQYRTEVPEEVFLSPEK